MSRHRVLRRALIVIGLISWTAPSAFAQPIGSFRWQFAPYCNVVTLDVVQALGTFTLSGLDEGCSGGRDGHVTGTAALHGGGSEVRIFLTITRSDRIAVTVDIDMVIATLTGGWVDSSGNFGTFVPNPPSPAPGQPRPVTRMGVYSAGFGAGGAGVSQLTPISFGTEMDNPGSDPIAAPLANIIPFGGAPTANCPGSFGDPSAAPGQLCLYERSKINASYRVFDSNLDPDVAENLGAHLQVSSLGPGNVVVAGAWAISIR
jgi:hypothetical protein